MIKNSKLISASIVFVMVLSGFIVGINIPEGTIPLELSENVSGSFAGGNGSASNPYQISNVTQLQAINQNLSKNFILINDINASETINWNGGKGFDPIGNDMGWYFSGVLDGNGYNITDLFINRNEYNKVGLMEVLCGNIRNISLKNSTITGKGEVGGLVGTNRGSIYECHTYGQIRGKDTIGGLVGSNQGRIRNSSSSSAINGTSSSIGGLVGTNRGYIENSSALGEVIGDHNVGGFVGLHSEGSIYQCHCTSIVHAKYYYGGFVGKFYSATINNSYYCYNYSKINNMYLLTSYGIYRDQFELWKNNDNKLNITDYLSFDSVNNCYNISNLQNMKDSLPFIQSQDVNFIQIDDIDLKSEPGFCIPVMKNGSYDGNGHVIENLNLSSNGTMSGLFGYLLEECVVKNVSISKSFIDGYSTIGLLAGAAGWSDNHCFIENCTVSGQIICNGGTSGGLVGFNGGTISNCTIEVNLSGNNYNGGLAGDNRGTISYCTTKINLSGNYYIGGLVGSNKGKIKNSKSSGYINGEGYIGGLCGYNNNPYPSTPYSNFYGLIIECNTNCIINGSISVGGLIGFNDEGTIWRSYSVGRTLGTTNVGGLIGYTTGGGINETYSEVQVIGSVGSNNLGGLIGWVTTYDRSIIIENSYSKGNVSGKDCIGGLIGNISNQYWNVEGKLVNCYSTGNVSGTSKIGGLIGERYKSSISVNDCLWDYQSSGINTSDGGTGKNTTEMKNLSTYVDMGWDFDSIWMVNENHEYPTLLKIWDKELPIFTKDYSSDIATTGDIFNFNISVSDNIRIESVYVEYWFGSDHHKSKEMNGIGFYQTNITMPPRSSSLHYIFSASDIAGNTNTTSRKDVKVIDNDKPIFLSDSTPVIGTTGDSFQFNISIFDNILVGHVFVEYWYGNGYHINSSINGSNPYLYKIDIHSNSTSKLHYIFHTSDSAGNWNETSEKEVMILDNDKVNFEIDSTPGYGTTGDMITFNISVTDNIDIRNVTIEYWYGLGIHYNRTMVGSGSYMLTLSVPSDIISLHYIFHANDSAGNWNETEEKVVIIIDNDKVIFGIDSTPVFGTTGDTVTFNISITDNIDVRNVSVEYWFGSSIHYNSTMIGYDPYLLTVSIPYESIDMLHYIFHANDSAGNWNETTQKDLTIIDNDKPILMNDFTSRTCTTGDPFSFNVSINDNIRVMEVSVEYWYENGLHFNYSMEGEIFFALSIDISLNSLSSLHYIFHFCDNSSNWNSTNERVITIIDNDKPIIYSDQTSSVGTTGDKFIFRVNAWDNVLVEEVWVDYYFGLNERMNVTMELDSNYILTTTIPDNSLESGHYRFHVKDNSGNWNSTKEIEIKVFDNDPPFLIEDLTLTEGSTGNIFNFSIDLTDNILIGNAWVEYWFGDDIHENVSMSGMNTFHYSIIIPSDNMDDLNYIFHFNDTSGNWNQTVMKSIPISDSIPPILISDNSSNCCCTGKDFFFKVDISDNIGISKVSVEYWFGENEHSFIDLESQGNEYLGIIQVPVTTELILHYIVIAIDNSDLISEFDQVSLVVIDDIPPTIEPLGNITITEGDMVNIIAHASDNIGISSITWLGSPLIANGNVVEGVINDPGNYSIQVIVEDISGNRFNISFVLTVLPIGNDDDIDDDADDDQPNDDDTDDDQPDDDDNTDDDTNGIEEKGMKLSTILFIFGAIVLILAVILVIVFFLLRKKPDEENYEQTEKGSEEFPDEIEEQIPVDIIQPENDVPDGYSNEPFYPEEKASELSMGNELEIPVQEQSIEEKIDSADGEISSEIPTQQEVPLDDDQLKGDVD